MALLKTVLVALSRTGLQEGFLRLASPSTEIVGGDIPQRWQFHADNRRLVEQRSYELSKFIHLGEYQRNDIPEDFVASTEYSANGSKIFLEYKQYLQKAYDPEFNFVMLTIDGDASSAGVSRLLSPTVYSGFLKIIESLPIVFGYNTSHDSLSYLYYEEFDHFVRENVINPKEVRLSDTNELLIIGASLGKYLGVNKLRRAKSPSLREISSPGGSKFLFLNPSSFPEISIEGDSSLSTPVSAEHVLWELGFPLVVTSANLKDT